MPHITIRPIATIFSTRRTSFIKRSPGRYSIQSRSEGEFGQQSGISLRNTGIFPTGTNTIVANPFAPTYFGSVNFIHQFPGALSPGVTTPDANSDYTLYTTSAYARDTIEITRWLQIIAGARFDRFDESALDKNTNINRSIVNNKVSPQAAVIVKPIENLSLYYAYSVSYLPAPGDQFSTLTDGSVILAPQKFVNNEVGVKWNINPKLLLTAAVYDLNRYNVPLPDPNNPGFFILSGSNRIQGFETSLNGYITDRLAVDTRLRLHRRTRHKRYIGDDRRQATAYNLSHTISFHGGISIKLLRFGAQLRLHLFLRFFRLIG